MILLYTRLATTSLVGMLMMLLEKSSSMEETAKKANVIYEGFVPFIKRDWKGVCLNILAIMATFLIFGGAIGVINKFVEGKTYSIFGLDIPLSVIWFIFVEIAFFSTGYFGQDWILRRLVKSVQNRLIKEAIDYKTTIADTASGTLSNPTPASK